MLHILLGHVEFLEAVVICHPFGEVRCFVEAGVDDSDGGLVGRRGDQRRLSAGWVRLESWLLREIPNRCGHCYEIWGGPANSIDNRFGVGDEC